MAFKRLFGEERNEDLIVHFINDVMDYKGDAKITHAVLLPTSQIPEIAAAKQSVVDVLCESNDGKKIIVEMQVSGQRSYIKRAQFYAAKAYSKQLTLERQQELTQQGAPYDEIYNELMPVIFIAVTNYIMFPKRTNCLSRYEILEKESLENDLKDFYYTFLELPKFKKGPTELEGRLDKWCYFLKHAEGVTKEELALAIGNDPVMNKAYDELDQFNWTKEELEIYEQVQKKIWDSMAAEQYMIEEAEARGEARGEERGKAKEQKAVVMRMHKTTTDKTIIATASGLTVEEVENILATAP
jgi:predicted transposase/invertase (TIGR01784 family)